MRFGAMQNASRDLTRRTHMNHHHDNLPLPLHTSWRWQDDKAARQRREDRLIAYGLIFCLVVHAVLLLRPLWN